MPGGLGIHAATRACVLARRTAQQGPEPPARKGPCAKAPLEAASPGTAGCQTCTGALGCQARGAGCAAQAAGAHGPAAHCMAPMAMGCRPCAGCMICGCCWLSTQGSGCCPPRRRARLYGLLSTLPHRDAEITTPASNPRGRVEAAPHDARPLLRPPPKPGGSEEPRRRPDIAPLCNRPVPIGLPDARGLNPEAGCIGRCPLRGDRSSMAQDFRSIRADTHDDH